MFLLYWPLCMSPAPRPPIPRPPITLHPPPLSLTPPFVSPSSRHNMTDELFPRRNVAASPRWLGDNDGRERSPVKHRGGHLILRQRGLVRRRYPRRCRRISHARRQSCRAALGGRRRRQRRVIRDAWRRSIRRRTTVVRRGNQARTRETEKRHACARSPALTK